ncbi:hypothetical protein HBI50_137020 [Parastagonospora nodorum]|nr:hypothetical protein HBI50_137020 [Parastagonospora nodorum]
MDEEGDEQDRKCWKSFHVPSVPDNSFHISFFNLSNCKTNEEITPNGPDTPAVVDSEKGVGSQTASEKGRGDESLSSNAQAGVKAVEAATIWWIYFVTALQEVVVRAMNPYVTSAFRLHSLTAATGIMSSIIGGLSKIPLAKLLDIWSRPQGLLLSLFVWIIGYIMMASCQNVETHAAAQHIGSQAVSYILTVFIADTSTFKNQALMLSFATSPYVITTWIGGPVAQSVLAGPGWRWAFGIFTIVIPLAILVLYNDRKAHKQGLLETRKIEWSIPAIKKFCVDIDLIGILMLVADMALFLLPLALWSYQAKKWESPMIIGMIVAGFILLVAFPIWEKFFAPSTIIPLTSSSSTVPYSSQASCSCSITSISWYRARTLAPCCTLCGDSTSGTLAMSPASIALYPAFGVWLVLGWAGG